MPMKTSRVLMLCLLGSALGVATSSAQSVQYYAVDVNGFVAGDVVAHSIHPSGQAVVGLAIEGSDLTAACISPYCHGDMAPGIHGATQTVALSFDGTQTLWEWNSLSLQGTYLQHQIIANLPGVLPHEFGGFEYMFTPGATPATFTGVVQYIVPEPAGLASLLTLCVGCATLRERRRKLTA